ncbi:hypothetical protein [Phenylobacterium sp.]|uniref:hypothetical protein n=1 Tax=Phenylobacterium sp. TaxID=1871053 RepID=UPI0025E061A7|nr:hypothetical protein [Phenylobacterium sp.]
MTAAASEPGTLDIARVIQQTFSVLGRNFVTYFILALILAGVPYAIIGLVQASTMSTVTETGPGFAYSLATMRTTGIGAIAAVITGCILQGAIIFATVQDMNGAKPSVGDSLATGLRAFLPLLGVSILFGLAVGFGLVLLIVPGLMIACAWCVAVPALVAERTGVLGAFGRAADLTRHNRWRVFGLFVLVWVATLIIGGVLGLLITMLTFGSGGLDPVRLALNPVRIIGSALINSLTAMLSATGVAVLYVELRKAKDGVGPQWLADIFT